MEQGRSEGVRFEMRGFCVKRGFSGEGPFCFSRFGKEQGWADGDDWEVSAGACGEWRGVLVWSESGRSRANGWGTQKLSGPACPRLMVQAACNPPFAKCAKDGAPSFVVALAKGRATRPLPRTYL